MMNKKRDMFPRISDLRSVKIIEVIEVRRVVGEGIEKDPARLIHEYYSFGGKLLARKDEFITLPDPPKPSSAIKE